MSAEDDPKHPLWLTYENEDPPEKLYAGYYQGLSGRWLMTSTGGSDDPPRYILSQMDRPAKLLIYKLVEARDFPMEERLELRRKETRVRQPVIKQPRVRMPLRVRKPIGG